ncbi:TonB family protein [Blochmannia endosymbiont of Camponotus sp. C-003]|uniref:TonB family protein n=1 Tax=unclassified Candidatus Blochmanniella TaxID=711328 RepID=UPI00202568C1|nr:MULTISPECIES: TonB family protein [unclassified Candidatus Blochmannia]URJ23393.1 TonB family protein [Blochmannia endosymbiont of Camponotus sp. C-003]URJ28866.1 TonB family protein [Blochmannia endosymbiont of Camponotus sp. C-046]
MHVLVIYVLLNRYCHFVNTSTYTQRSQIITLSLLQSNQLFHESLEKNHVSKKFEPYRNQQNPRAMMYSKNKIVDSSQHKSNTNSNFHLIKKNNVNIEDSTLMHSLNLSQKNYDRTYISSCIINRVYPEYPNRARILNIAGKITVQYDVNTKGRVENIHILSAVPPGIFEESIRSAMRRWVYERDRPEKKLIITFKFCLNAVKIFGN